ncbi:unnamed protein product [Durusdinium trenchii]|uniref:Uncharacterized protein n=2 Tax=Durusdinium trenchii TaxID=1381693 RepID=A0ABP0JK41_9DINO
MTGHISRVHIMGWLVSRACERPNDLGSPSKEDFAEPAVVSPLEPKRYRREFAIMTWMLSLNHAAVTTPILYASSVLTNASGQAGNAVLYGATLICSLFFSTLIFGLLGSKRGLSLSMGLYSVYVLLFAIAAALCDEKHEENGSCIRGGHLQLPINLVGALVGGLGAGILWTCQGAFFSEVCARVAAAEGDDMPKVTAELAGSFALVFLAMEAVVRASATILTKHAHLDYPAVFLIFAGLAVASTVIFQLLAKETESEPRRTGDLCGKALSALRQWTDPQTWFLQCTNLTFGFAAAWLGGHIGREILTEALSSEFIGYAGALLSALASGLSLVLGQVARRMGKGPVVALGSMAFLFLGILSQYVGKPATWGWGVLVFYLLMGLGRAVYESTNKAIFADFFPGEKSAGAFANVFVFGTSASTVAFTLGAVGKASEELYLLLTFAVLTMPGYLTACVIKRHLEKREQETASPSVEASV